MATTTPTSAPGDRRTRVRVAVVALVAVALLAAAAVWFVAHHRAEARDRAELDAAVAALAPVAEELRQTVDAGHQALSSAEGRLTDPAVGADMAAALAEAESLDTDPPTTGSTAERTDVVVATRERAQDHLDTLGDLSAALLTDSYRYDLQQEVAAHDSAVAALDGAVTAAQQALAAGAGTAEQRSALAGALDAAAAARATPVDPEDIDSVIAATTAVGDARTALEAATAAVTG